MPAFGEKIRAVRMMRGIKQSELAAFLSVKQQSISKLENGKVNVSGEIAEKVACYFGFCNKEEMESFYESYIRKHLFDRSSVNKEFV